MSAGRPLVAVVAFSTITGDTRVMRTIRTLAEAGYDVAAVGFGTPPPHVSRFVPLPVPLRSLATRVAMVLRHLPAAVLPGRATLMHDLSRLHRAARAALCGLRPDVVHANDWPVLPAALAAKAACGARIVYDSHELAIEEHAHRRSWRLLMRSHVAAIEMQCIAHADRVIAVSDGIARELAERYQLRREPTVVRNVPPWEQQPFRPTARPRRLLFHGILKDWRGIEIIVAAMPHLPQHVLTLRGSAVPGYAARLDGLIRNSGAADRIALEAAVPPEAVVSCANAADLGLFLGPIDTRHNRYALPNKLFEYVMAGLGVVVSPGEDMAGLVRRHGFGQAVAPSVDALVEALNRLPDAAVDRMKQAALAAARELCWQRERQRLLDLYATLFPMAGAAAARHAAPAGSVPQPLRAG